MINEEIEFERRRTIATLIEGNPEMFSDNFARWLGKNHHIWRTFDQIARQIARRRRHYSARTIIEKIRCDTDLAEIDGEFKINNNVAPDLARLWALLHPESAHFFEFRVMPNSRRAA